MRNTTKRSKNVELMLITNFVEMKQRDIVIEWKGLQEKNTCCFTNKMEILLWKYIAQVLLFRWRILSYCGKPR